MADWYIHCDSHFNSLDVYNMEMPVEPEQGAVTAGSHFREGALDLMEDLRLISDLNHESEVIQIDQVNHKDGDENHKSHGRCQDPGEVQLQEPLPLATAVPQHPRRRSRVLFKLAAWQVQELENVFKKIQYPDVLTRKELSKLINVTEIRVKSWFKNRRAKYRKILKETMNSDDQNVAQHDIFPMMLEEL